MIRWCGRGRGALPRAARAQAGWKRLVSVNRVKAIHNIAKYIISPLVIELQMTCFVYNL